MIVVTIGKAICKPDFCKDIYLLFSMFPLTCYCKMWQNSARTFNNNNTKPNSTLLEIYMFQDISRMAFISPSLMLLLSETLIYAPAELPV